MFHGPLCHSKQGYRPLKWIHKFCLNLNLPTSEFCPHFSDIDLNKIYSDDSGIEIWVAIYIPKQVTLLHFSVVYLLLLLLLFLLIIVIFFYSGNWVVCINFHYLSKNYKPVNFICKCLFHWFLFTILKIIHVIQFILKSFHIYKFVYLDIVFWILKLLYRLKILRVVESC